MKIVDKILLKFQNTRSHWIFLARLSDPCYVRLYFSLSYFCSLFSCYSSQLIGPYLTTGSCRLFILFPRRSISIVLLKSTSSKGIAPRWVRLHNRSIRAISSTSLIRSSNISEELHIQHPQLRQWWSSELFQLLTLSGYYSRGSSSPCSWAWAGPNKSLRFQTWKCNLLYAWEWSTSCLAHTHPESSFPFLARRHPRFFVAMLAASWTCMLLCTSWLTQYRRVVSAALVGQHIFSRHSGSSVMFSVCNEYGWREYLWHRNARIEPRGSQASFRGRPN